MAEKIKNGVKKILFPERARRMNRGVEVVLCPSFDSLKSVAEVLKIKSPLKVGGSKGGLCLGAQDMFWEKRGAFTGEESALNLKEAGCEYVILGHSERRKLGETDEDVRKKTIAALKAGLIPIVCIGETLAEKKKGKTKQVIQRQISAIFSGMRFPRGPKGFTPIIIAYEPVWAIGTGIYAKVSDVKKVRDFILKFLKGYLSQKQMKNIIIIYGGSVDSKNISEFLIKGGMEGALVGGASLDAREFINIIKNYSTK